MPKSTEPIDPAAEEAPAWATRGPTATITMDKSIVRLGESVTVTITFSEPVNGLYIEDIILDGAASSDVSSLTESTAVPGGETWTLVFTPTDNVEDPHDIIGVMMDRITINITSIVSRTGIDIASGNLVVDTRHPTATITLDKTVLEAGQTATVIASFSESVTDDVVLTDANGQLSAFTASADARIWMATFTPWSMSMTRATPSISATTGSQRQQNSIPLVADSQNGMVSPDSSACITRLEYAETPHPPASGEWK